MNEKGKVRKKYRIVDRKKGRKKEKTALLSQNKKCDPTMEYYVEVKKNKVITFTCTQMDMESTMLTGRSEGEEKT